MAFENKILREICEDEDRAISKYGPKIAEKLKDRLADLSAAKSINDILVGNPRSMDNSQNYKIDLIEGHCIVLCANHVKNPVIKDNCLNWSKVTHIKILQIDKSNE